MNRLRLLCMPLAIGFGLTFISVASPQTLPPTVTEKVQAAQKQIKTIGTDEYRNIVDHPAGTLIVDVRGPQEFAAGHVPGAINIPRGVLEFTIWKQVGYPTNTQMDQPSVLQCQSGKRASLAAQTLMEIGFTQVSAVIMGLEDRQKAGHPFEK